MLQVSIILPVYNSELTIISCLNSILNQTFQNFEVIVIDNGSSDKTVQLIQNLNDERIIILFQPIKGISHALNLGLLHAKGEYLVRMDADDIMVLDRLEIQINEFYNDLTLDFLASDCFLCDNEMNIVGELHKPNSHFSLISLFYSPFIHPTWMFRKSILSKIGTYNTDLFVTQDYDFIVRLLINGFKSKNINKKLIYYRQSSNGLSIKKHFYQLYFSNLISYNFLLFRIFKKKYKPNFTVIYKDRKFFNFLVTEKIKSLNLIKSNNIKLKLISYFKLFFISFFSLNIFISNVRILLLKIFLRTLNIS